MKRRNADAGKLRRPIKRTKVTEGMYGNSMLYVKFILLWSSIALADYMLEFRFEFLWPLWLVIKAIYHCYYCKGLVFTIFFTCVALISDLICYFYIPMQMLTYLAGVYVWVNSVCNTFESKGVCAQTVAMSLLVIYAEALRNGIISAVLSCSLTSEPDDWIAKPWAASALGFPIVSFGVVVKQLLDEKLRLRTQRQVRAQNEFYFRLMREAIPEGGISSSSYSNELFGGETESGGELKQNGSAKRRWKPDSNGHWLTDKEDAVLKAKLEHLELFVKRKTRARDSSSQSTHSQKSTNSVHNSVPNSVHNSVQSSTQPSPHMGHTNGVAKGPGCPTEELNHCKGGSKSTKYDKKEANISLKEERRRKKNRDIDRENIDSHKSREHTKEQDKVDKDLESTKECVKVNECNNNNKEEEMRQKEERKREREEEKKWHEERKRERDEQKRRERDEDKRREKERERELREREKEKEKEKEKERERERELLSAQECAEELSRMRAALALSQKNEAESERQLALEKQRRVSQTELKQQLQHKMSTWRSGERAALERKLGEERRLRLVAEQQLLKMRRTPHGECESEWCKSRRTATETEAVTLRKELQRTRERLAQTQRDLNLTNEKVVALEAEKSVCAASIRMPNGAVWQEMQARTAHLEMVLSSETRVKLDLLAALGDANRKMHIQESILNRKEKELEELKAQMLAVMPAEFISTSPNSVSKMRLPEGSPLDPNATVYTPKQLCSDA